MYDTVLSMGQVLWAVAESLLSEVPPEQRSIVGLIVCIVLYGLLITRSKR